VCSSTLRQWSGNRRSATRTLARGAPPALKRVTPTSARQGLPCSQSGPRCTGRRIHPQARAISCHCCWSWHHHQKHMKQKRSATSGQNNRQSQRLNRAVHQPAKSRHCRFCGNVGLREAPLHQDIVGELLLCGWWRRTAFLGIVVGSLSHWYPLVAWVRAGPSVPALARLVHLVYAKYTKVN
jgi:hypothetical protein